MTNPMQLHGLPTWFRANISSARSQGYLGPGVYGNWSTPGYHLGLHWADYVEEDVADQANEAFNAVREGDVEEALNFLQTYLPRFLKVVPTRRRVKFATGFLNGTLR